MSLDDLPAGNLMLAKVDDWDQLAQVGELIVRAETSGELTRRMVTDLGRSG